MKIEMDLFPLPLPVLIIIKPLSCTAAKNPSWYSEICHARLVKLTEY